MMDYPVTPILAGSAAAYAAAALAAHLIARAGFPLPPDHRRIGCIDGLRGYLAVSVMVHHFIIWMQVTHLGGGWAAPTVNLFNQLGGSAVALFFMTTGLVFYPRVLAGLRKSPWPAIYIKRVFRIVPLAAASVMIIAAIIAARTGQGPDGGFPLAFATWITTWSMPPLLGYPDSGRINAYVLWSLWYEWLFYLFVLPACALAMDLIRDRLPSWTVPAALLTGAVSARIFFETVSLLTFLPLFAIGMLAFECQRSERIARLLRTSYAGIAALAALAIGLVMFNLPYFHALPFLSFFFVCAACGNAMGGWLRTRAALLLGECSYGIYLLHGIVLSLVFVDAGALTRTIGAEHLPILLPLAVCAAVPLAAAAYLAVERPGINAGAWLTGRLTGRPADDQPAKRPTRFASHR